MTDTNSLSDFDLAAYVRRRILTRAAEVVEYTNWSDDFAAQFIRELPADIRATEGLRPIRVENLTMAQMDDLGFGYWSSKIPMRSIPQWLLPYLPDGVESMTSISHRLGRLAYAVLPADYTPPAPITTGDGDNDNR